MLATDALQSPGGFESLPSSCVGATPCSIPMRSSVPPFPPLPFLLPATIPLPLLLNPRATLLAAVAAMGGVPIDLGIVKDKEATLKGAVEAALEQCDVLVTSGGVSMGEADLLKPILEVTFPSGSLTMASCVRRGKRLPIRACEFSATILRVAAVYGCWFATSAYQEFFRRYYSPIVAF